jgi:RNA-directed DNA polymerase
MTKAPVSLQDLRRRIYRKAKSDKTHRFWGLFVHIAKTETLLEAYRQARRNAGAPGIDGQTFAEIEAEGLAEFLAELRDDLQTSRYQPQPNRRVEIPKDNGKVRVLQIPCIRDRVVQGALKLILEAVFEADFCPNSYGFRPKRSPHRALAEVRRSVMRRMSTVVDVDLTPYFEAVNYHRFADDIVITISGHSSKRGWAERALQRLQEQLGPLGVELNREKTQVVDTLNGEAFGFLGFDLRRVPKSGGNGYFIVMTPKKKARKAIKARIRDIIRRGGATPVKVLVARINAVLAGWVDYFRVGNSSRAFSEVHNYLEMKIRTLLTRRKRRSKCSVGWRRWSNEYLCEVLGLFWDWKRTGT